MTKTRATEILNEPETKALMGRSSRTSIKQAFEELEKPELPSLLSILRDVCRKREGTLLTDGLLSDDERAYLAGLLSDIEQTQVSIKGLLDASPVMATDADRRKVMTSHLKTKFQMRQIQSR